jgi:peptide chain release factor 2
MKSLQNDLRTLQKAVSAAFLKLKITQLQEELRQIREDMQAPDFWNDTHKAQAIAQHEAKLRARIEPWLNLQTELSDIAELLEAHDNSMEDELQAQLEVAQGVFAALRQDLYFSGPYDDHDVILRLSAGAGGTDAQDWAQMLERMYIRWAERNNFKTQIIERSPGEEAGLKTSVIEIAGAFVYGKLKGEHGVHRLVRLSPFNSDNLRQTSFALVEILPQIDAPDEVAIDDKDLRIDVFRAGGHGGQSVNTTDSAVRVTHIPTGIVVSIQNERSQLQNKETAMKMLRSKLAQLQIEQHAETLAKVKGPTQSAEWGAQIRNYVLHPYTLVKDTRTKHEVYDAQAVLDGKLEGFIESYLESAQNT